MPYHELLKQLDGTRSKTSRFYRADLHVHTHDSDDYLTNHENLPATDFESRLTDSEKCWREKKVAIAPEEYIARFESLDPPVHIIAVTDHCTCELATALAKSPGGNVLVIPGIEIDVRTNVLVERDSIHLLCLFDPSKNSHTIWAHVAPDPSCTYGEHTAFVISDLKKYIDTNIHRNGGICVAAHVDQEKGIRRHFFDLTDRKYIDHCRRRDSLLAEKKALDNALVLGNPEQPGRTRAIEQRLETIETQLNELRTVIKADVTRIQERYLTQIADAGFDAIQVQKSTDGQHYVGQHVRALGLFPTATILASDAHTFQRYGSKFVWLKMPELSFDALKRALKFPTCRVRLGDYKRPRYPKVLGVRFSCADNSESFFRQHWGKCIHAAFSDNLTAIIGGRGSGKSALIDALKLVFKGVREEDRTNAAKIASQNDPRARKLPEWLQRLVATMWDTTLQVVWQNEGDGNDAETYVLELPFNAQFGSKVSVKNVEGQDTGLTIGDRRFRVDIYGWSEIERIGESREQQLELVDQFADTVPQRKAIEEAIAELVKNRSAVRALALKASECAESEDLAEYVQRSTSFAFYNTPATAKAFHAIDTIDLHLTALRSYSATLRTLRDNFDAQQYGRKALAANRKLVEAIRTASLVAPTSEQAAMEPTVDVRNDTPSHDLHDVIRERILAAVCSPGAIDISALRSAASQFVAALNRSITAAEDQVSVLEGERRSQVNAISSSSQPGDEVKKEYREQAKRRFAQSEQAAEKLNEYMTEIERLLSARTALRTDLVGACQKLTSMRMTVVSDINEKLEQEVNSNRLRIQIALHPNSNRRNFASHISGILDAAKNSIHYKEKKAPLLAEHLIPDAVREALVITHDASVFVYDGGTTESRITDKQARAIIEKCGCQKTVPMSDDGKRAATYYDVDRLDQALRFDEIVFDDAPEILLDSDPESQGQARPIASLSPGQRCCALLPIILLRGDSPVIIDQPEDNLDNKLIYDVVVEILQRLKERRQIIVATHNPNIPVSGDAEHVIVCRALSREEGCISDQAPIDSDNVIHQVKEIMEGGEEAFRLRARRYGVVIGAASAQAGVD